MAVVKMDEAPRKARDLYQKGFAAMERGNLEYAMDMFIAALELEPQLLEVRKFLRAAGLRKFKDGKGGAINHVFSTLTGFPAVLVGKGQLQKNPLKAVQSAEKLLRKDPLNVLFIYFLCDAAAAASMPEVALQALEMARDNRPKDLRLQRRLAQLYLSSNRPHDARAIFDNLVKLRPNDQELIKMQKDATALDTMQKGGWNSAGSFRDVIRDAKEATVLEQEAKAVKTSRDVDDLIVEMEGKREREPDNVNYIRSLADLYTRALRFDDAVAVLKEAGRLAGGQDPQIDRSMTEIRLKQFDIELTQLQESGDAAAVEAKETEREAFRLEDARERVTRYPNDLQFRYELGVLLFEHGELNEAVQQFQLSQRNPQRRIRSLYYLARCFRAKKQYEIAKEQLNTANEELGTMDMTKKEILYELGLLYEEMGEKEEAVSQFKQIYSVDIGYKDVAEKVEGVPGA